MIHPFERVPVHPLQRPSEIWTDDPLSEEGVCYWITDPAAPEDAIQVERDRDRPGDDHTCHHDGHPGSGW
jgi:hypothetical protein